MPDGRAGPGAARRRDEREPAPEALVYLPGLRLAEWGEKSKRGVVTRIANALDQEAPRRHTDYVVRWDAGAVSDKPGGSHVATILVSDRERERPVLDCYAFEWSGSLTRRWRAQGRLRRIGRLLLTIWGLPAFLRFFTTSGKKNPTGRMQLVLAVAASLVVVAYLLILVWAVGQTAVQMKAELAQQLQVGAEEERATAGDRARGKPSRAAREGAEDDVTWPQWLALIGSGVAVAIPGTRRKLSRAGAALGAAASYVRVAEGRALVTGEFTAYLEEILSENRHDRVTILAYSFGSIVALDAIFPTTSSPSKTFARVSSLVTIGSPYDFVVALRPTWKGDRHSLPGVPRRWVNIYSTIDLMGSNFRRDTASSEATVALSEGEPDTAVIPSDNVPWDLGIEPTLTNLFELHGFRSHGLYWGTDEESDERSVFTLVVQEALADSLRVTNGEDGERDAARE